MLRGWVWRVWLLLPASLSVFPNRKPQLEDKLSLPREPERVWSVLGVPWLSAVILQQVNGPTVLGRKHDQ